MEIEKLVIKLNNVSDSYYSFIVAVLSYVKKNESRFQAVTEFMDNDPDALSSDILSFITEQSDFYT